MFRLFFSVLIAGVVGSGDAIGQGSLTEASPGQHKAALISTMDRLCPTATTVEELNVCTEALPDKTLEFLACTIAFENDEGKIAACSQIIATKFYTELMRGN